MTVRVATPHDYEALLALYGSWLGTSRFESRASDSIAEVIASDSGHCAVAKVGCDLVGFITLSVRSVGRYAAPIAEIEELYVLPAYRRQGLGSGLLRHVEEIAATRRCCRLYVAASDDQPDGERIYLARGFVANGRHFRKALA